MSLHTELKILDTRISTLESVIFSTKNFNIEMDSWSSLTKDSNVRDKLQNLRTITFNRCFSQDFLKHLAGFAQSDGENWGNDYEALSLYLNHTWKRAWEQEKIYAFYDSGIYPKYLVFNTGLQAPRFYDDIFICLFRRPENAVEYAVKRKTIMIQNQLTDIHYKYWRTEALKNVFSPHKIPERVRYFDR